MVKIRSNLSVEFHPDVALSMTLEFLQQLPRLENYSLDGRFYGTFGQQTEEEYRALIRQIVQHRGTGAVRYCASGREVLLMTDDGGDLIEMGN